MEFTKMQGAGNDFIIINNLAENISVDKLPELVKRLCTRRLSIGADGVMVIVPPEKGGDFAMLFYNSDGSLGEMCGNGARCICRYGYEHGLAGDTQSVETTSGTVLGRRVDKRKYTVRLNDPTVMLPRKTILLDDRDYDCAYVELGSPGLPHCVLPMPDWDTLDIDSLRALGRALRFHRDFPKGANVTFVKLLSPTELKAVTFERGVEDFTLACGTGCGSTVAALTLRGQVTGENVHVAMPGGDLYVTVTAKDGAVTDIMLTGPTNVVCTGTVTDEDLVL